MIKKLIFGALFLFGFLLCQMAEECFADAAAQLEQAEKCEETGKYEEAEATYKQIVTEYPGTDDALEAQEKLTVLYISWDKEGEAEAAYQELLSEYGDHKEIAEVVDDVADAYRHVEKYDKALEIYSYLVDTWGDSEQAMGSQGCIARVNIKLGDDPNAEAAIEKLLAEFSYHDEIADVVDGVADEYREVRKYEKALELYKYVADSWPESEQAMGSQRDVAEVYIKLGDDPNAEAAVEKLIAEFSDRDEIADVVDGVADEYRDVKMYEKALQLYKYVVDSWPENEQAMGSQAAVAEVYIELGDDANALEAIDKLIADFNEHPDLSSAISSIEREYYIKILAADYPLREDYLNAVKVWEKVIKRFPDFFHDDPDLYYFIADCYRHLGEYEKAIQYYGTVASNWTVNGYAVVPHVVVPLPGENSGDYIAFHVLIDSLIADFGEDPGLAATILRTGYEYRRRANDARRQGLSSEAEVDNFKAIALYDRVINEFGSSAFVASAYFFSALSFRDLGQWQDALDCCNRLLDNWPEYKYASWARRLAQDCSERLATQVQ